MIVDLQGVGFSLCDPEIASSELKAPESDDILFCCGNLTTKAIEKFTECHTCNKYCDLLQLGEL